MKGKKRALPPLSDKERAARRPIAPAILMNSLSGKAHYEPTRCECAPCRHYRVLREALRAIADPEHCMTAHTVAGLRALALAGLNAKVDGPVVPGASEYDR